MMYDRLLINGFIQGECYTCQKPTGTVYANMYRKNVNCLDCYIKYGKPPKCIRPLYTWRQCSICSKWGLIGAHKHQDTKCICGDCMNKRVSKYVEKYHMYNVNYSVISKCPKCDTGLRITKKVPCNNTYIEEHQCETCDKREERRCFGCGVAIRQRNFTDNYKDKELDYTYTGYISENIHWCTSSFYREDTSIDDDFYDPTGDPYCQALRKHLEYHNVDHDLDLSSLYKQVFDIKYQLEKRKNERKKQNHQRTQKHPMGLHGSSDSEKDDCKGCKCDNRSSQQHHQGCEAGT